MRHLKSLVSNALLLVLLLPSTGWASERLTMEQSIEIALRNSLKLSVAQEGLQSAAFQRKEAATAFLPKMSTSYGYTRLHDDPGFYFQGFPPWIPAGWMKTGTKDNYQWNLEARQPLFAGGGLLAQYQAAKIAEDIARVEEGAVIQQIVLEVKIAYFQILQARRLQETAKQSVEMLSAHLETARYFYQVGLSAKTDVLQAEVELANAKQAFQRAQNAVELANARFNILLRREISEPVSITDTLIDRPLAPPFEDCLAAAQKNRPELQISHLKVAQAGKWVRTAESDYFPTVSASLQYSRFGNQPSLSGSDYKDAESWSVAALAAWNFWEWGKTKYRVEAAKTKERQAAASAKELSDQIRLEIKQAYLSLQENEKQLEASEKVIEKARENFRIAQARYREKVARATDVLDAQTLLTQAEAQYANALSDYQIGYAKLQRAIGILR